MREHKKIKQLLSERCHVVVQHSCFRNPTSFCDPAANICHRHELFGWESIGIHWHQANHLQVRGDQPWNCIRNRGSISCTACWGLSGVIVQSVFSFHLFVSLSWSYWFSLNCDSFIYSYKQNHSKHQRSWSQLSKRPKVEPKYLPGLQFCSTVAGVGQPQRSIILVPRDVQVRVLKLRLALNPQCQAKASTYF